MRSSLSFTRKRCPRQKKRHRPITGRCDLFEYPPTKSIYFYSLALVVTAFLSSCYEVAPFISMTDAFCVVPKSLPSSSFLGSKTMYSSQSSLWLANNKQNFNNFNNRTSSAIETVVDSRERRRAIVSTFFTALAATATAAGTASTGPPSVPSAVAATDDSSTSTTSSPSSKTSTTQAVYDFLQDVPTFCLTNEGVPYFVVGEDAKLTSYFFVSYGEAERILQLARTSSDIAIKEAMNDPTLSSEQKSEIRESGNPWQSAQITTVDLKTAVTLVSKSTKSLYFKISPSVDDVQDALRLDKDKNGKDDLPEGKVPLFYYENFTIPVGTETPSSPSKKTPLYFRKSELEQEYKKQYQKQEKTRRGRNKPPTSSVGEVSVDSTNAQLLTAELPEIKVTELFAVIQEILSDVGGGKGTGGDDNDDDEIRNLMLISPKESLKKKQECLRRRPSSSSSSSPQFVVGQRIIVL